MAQFGIKELVEFYPRWQSFVNEAKSSLPQSQRIGVTGTVVSQDGTEVDMKALNFEMESAKTAIVSQSPEFAPYVHHFDPIYTWVIPTMATDGSRLFVNPKFAQELSWEQKIFVLIHEIMHCVLMHMERLKGRDPELFNIAGDYEINALIVDTISSFSAEFVHELQGLYEAKYLNFPVETIYRDVAKNRPPTPQQQQNNQQNQGPQDDPSDGEGEGEGEGEGQGEGQGQGEGEGEGEGQGGSGSGSGQGGQPGQGSGQGGQPGQGDGQPGQGSGQGGKAFPQTGGVDPAGTGGIISKELGREIAKQSGLSDEELRDTDEEDEKGKWEAAARDMMTRLEKGSSKQSGGGKGNSLLTALQKIHKTEVNWKAKFKQYVATALSGEKYQKLGNKKHLGKDYFKYGERDKVDALKHIVVMCDVSGSMGQDLLEKILNEINGIIFAKKVKKITVLFYDGEVDRGSIQVINKGGNRPFIPKNVSGGGGTSFQVGLDYIKEELKDNLTLCINFTDGYAPMPKAPKWARRYIWIVYDNPGFEKPFGKLINMG